MTDHLPGSFFAKPYCCFLFDKAMNQIEIIPMDIMEILYVK
jgi:hypothetical protein